MPEKELVAELIREKALLFMRDEIPHGLAVVVERFKERPGTDLVDIDVNIYCERESHKGMVIGKGGAMLKKIASAARADCEEFLGCRVNLQCWVKVKPDWRDNEFLLNSFGFRHGRDLTPRKARCRQMDAESCWKAFASTGKIGHYLDYRRAAAGGPAPGQGTCNGRICDHGPGAAGDRVRRSGPDPQDTDG